MKSLHEAFLCITVLLATCMLAPAQANPTPADASMPNSQAAPDATPNSSQAVVHAVPNKPAPGNQGRRPEMVIGEGDLLQISVYGAEDFANKEVRVSSAGEILLPLVGAVKVAGLTVEQAEQLIAKRLSDGQYFNNPQVWVFEKEYATQGVSVLGEVQKPGKYPLLGQHTLFDAISVAGGTTPKAGNVATITHRDRPAQPETVSLSYAPGMQNGNILVYPGDTVVVSKAGIVYVVGDVKLPSGIVLENSKLTVLQAVAMAQGANPTASLNNAKVIRTSNGQRQEIPIKLKKILEAKAADTQLQAGDILFIPSSVAKSVTRRSLESALQVATGIAIYRP